MMQRQRIQDWTGKLIGFIDSFIFTAEQKGILFTYLKQITNRDCELFNDVVKILESNHTNKIGFYQFYPEIRFDNDH